MAKRKQSKSEMQRQIALLQIKKRNGLMRAIVAFVAMAVVIMIKLYFQGEGAEWANTSFANMGIFILAIVAAAVAGMGTRSWKKASDQVKELERKLYK